MAFGLGEWLQGIGGTLDTIGTMKSNNKARKNRINALNNTMDQFGKGTSDAFGNKYSLGSNGWKYDLSNSGNANRLLSNRNSYLANTLGNIAPSVARNRITAADNLASQMQANANQSAAFRNALRTGSNIGNIASAFGHQGNSQLQAQMQQNLRNGLDYAAQNANNYITNATNAQNPIQNIQNNLQNQQQIAPALMTSLGTQLANAVSVPKTNWLQTGGKLASGWGTGIANSEAADRQTVMELLKSFMGMMGGIK